MNEQVYSFGKNNLYVNEGLLTSARSRYVSAGVLDRLRNVLRRFYTVKNEGMIRYENNFTQPSLFEASVVYNGTGKSNPAVRFRYLTDPINDEASQRSMVALANLIDTNTQYLDCFFKRQLPIDSKVLKKMNKVGKAEYIEPHSNYSFFIPRYEKFIKNNPTLSENVLPNFYTLYAQEIYKQSNVKDLNSLGGNFKSKKGTGSDTYVIGESEETFLSSLGEDKDIVKDSFAKYFDTFAQSANKMVKSATKSKVLRKLSSDYNTYIFTADTLPLLTTEAVKAEGFPLYNEIKFSADTNCSFSSILHELKIGDEIIKEVIKNTGPQMKLGRSSQELIPSEIKNEPPKEKYNFTASRMRSWDIRNWMTNKIFNQGKIAGVIIGENKKRSGEANVGIFDLLTKTILAAKVNKFARSKIRTFKEVFDGKQSYSEAVFYKIEKYSEDDLNTPVTTYYIPNSALVDEYRFIDTQIRYGKKYIYSLTSYVIVVGSEYSYNAPVQMDSRTVDIRVKPAPSVKLIEVPMVIVRDVMVLDNPPLPPESLMVSYKGISNKILINMNGSTGDVEMVPAVLEPSDKGKIDRLRLSQRREMDDRKLRFKNDGAPAAFEIFRTTTKPSSYKDFRGKKIRVVATKQIATSAAFEDKISPNVKYYYAIRSIDVHGNISNPSPVYEMEMKSLEGPPYMVMNVIDFEEEKKKNKVPLKSMRRYVQIIPTTPQGLLNVDESQLMDATTVKGVRNVFLGVSDEALWGKKFRIRFTSKKTGRKIDLDVNFTTKHQLKQS